jgi:hypothetical protein
VLSGNAPFVVPLAQGMVSWLIRPSRCAPGSHFFLAEQHASEEGGGARTARFVRVHRSVAESLDAPPALATLFREKMGDFTRFFVFKMLTRARRAVAGQPTGVEDFSS